MIRFLLFLGFAALMRSLLEPHVQLRESLLAREEAFDEVDFSLLLLDVVMAMVSLPAVWASVAEASERMARRKCSRIAIVDGL